MRACIALQFLAIIRQFFKFTFDINRVLLVTPMFTLLSITTLTSITMIEPTSNEENREKTSVLIIGVGYSGMRGSSDQLG